MRIKKLLNKKNMLAAILVVVTLVAFGFASISKSAKQLNESEAVTLQPTYSAIMASGSIASVNQASLHFQGGGKLVYLPFKEGDFVSAGTVIASLDSLEAQKTVTAAEANYRSAKAALDLVIDNIHLFQYGNGGFANVGSGNETQTQKTQRQQAEEVVNVAYDNLQKAKKELENTYIVAPFDGTIVHEDVKDIGVNITSATTFIMADLSKLIFQAEVSSNDIAYVVVGDKVQISLDDKKDRKLSGAVSKIYPEKIKLASGGEGYEVDIEIDELGADIKFGMTGSGLFENKFTSHVPLVPSWVVLGNQYIWVMDQNTLKFKKVAVGETFGDKTQIIEGLSSSDQIILNPEAVIKKRYKII